MSASAVVPPAANAVMTAAPVFTRDEKRIAILRRNEAEGFQREQMPHAARGKLDLVATTVDAAHIRDLRRRVGLVASASV